MKRLHLSKRLMAVAEYIEHGSRVADIGTDHGYLPVWLIQNNVCDYVIAADIGEGPLNQAKRFAAEYLAEERITFVLTDGLSGIQAELIDTIVLAGMGGETIINILNAFVPHAGEHKLIVQPQSKIGELTIWLYNAGYKIAKQRLVRERGNIYTVMKVSAGASEKPDDAEMYISRTLYESGDPLLAGYIDLNISKLTRALAGVSKAGRDKEKKAHLNAAVRGLNKMKEGLIK